MADKQLLEYYKADYEAAHGIGTYSRLKMMKALFFEYSFKYMFWWRRTHFHYLKGNSVRFRLNQIMNKHYQHKYGCEIAHTTEIGKGAVITHPYGIVVFADKIGDAPWFHSGCVIGASHNNGHSINPKIGNHVSFGVGCKVIGNVTIGNNVIIGANAVVTHDVPDHSIVAGIPARVIGHCDSVWD